MRWLLNILFHGDLSLTSCYSPALFFLRLSHLLSLQREELIFILHAFLLCTYFSTWIHGVFFVWVGPDPVLAGKGEEWERWY